jgi:hypothetical protein
MRIGVVEAWVETLRELLSLRTSAEHHEYTNDTKTSPWRDKVVTCTMLEYDALLCRVCIHMIQIILLFCAVA